MKSFLKKHETVIRYFTFGLLPVLVSFGVYVLIIDLGMLIFSQDGHASGALVTISKTVSWFATSITAYFINMLLVFKERPPTIKGLLAQLTKSLSARGGTYCLGLVVTLSVKYLLQHSHIIWGAVINPDNVGWFVGCGFEVFVNYFVAKKVVFRKKVNKSEKEGQAS